MFHAQYRAWKRRARAEVSMHVFLVVPGAMLLNALAKPVIHRLRPKWTLVELAGQRQLPERAYRRVECLLRRPCARRDLADQMLARAGSSCVGRRDLSESPRVLRRHPPLRRYSHELVKEVLTQSTRACRSNGARASWGVPANRRSVRTRGAAKNLSVKNGSVEFQVGCRACRLIAVKSSLPAIRKMTVSMVDRRVKPRARRLAAWNKPLMASRKPLV